MNKQENLSRLYRHRFVPAEQGMKRRIWRALCDHFFQDIVGRDKVVLDLACGYGEFINAIQAKKKYGVDLNPDSAKFVSGDVELFGSPAMQIPLPADSVDVVFTSNFLEHLTSKDECSAVLGECHRILRPGGKMIIMGPNIRYLADKYWDFYDHHLPLSHLSLEEGLLQAGFVVERLVPRFLPYTAVKTRLPTHPVFVTAYLKVPFVWRFMGHQFLAVARKPSVCGP